MSQVELLARLAVALGLCSLIGIERELHQKSAGLRTHTLVGLGAALAMIVSKYGFADVVGTDGVDLDPSRVAAQIVSGIGFVGAGLIFVRGDSVRGLTTAAVVWLTAMVGMACGAGMLLIAAATTLAHLAVVTGQGLVARRLPRSRWSPAAVRVSYVDGRGVLREALTALTSRGFSVAMLDIDRDPADHGTVDVALQVYGRGSVSDLVAELAAIGGVLQVAAGDDGDGR